MMKFQTQGCVVVCDDSKVVVSRNGSEIVISFENDDVSISVVNSVRPKERQQRQQRQEEHEERREERDERDEERREERREENSRENRHSDNIVHRNDEHSAISHVSSDDDVEPASSRQIGYLNSLAAKLKLSRPEKLALISSIVKRQVSSSKELSKKEAGHVIDELKKRWKIQQLENELEPAEEIDKAFA